jgi:hypothetical protein
MAGMAGRAAREGGSKAALHRSRPRLSAISEAKATRPPSRSALLSAGRAARGSAPHMREMHVREIHVWVVTYARARIGGGTG